MDKIQSILSSNVRRLREALNLTREELAELAGISPQNLAKIENGDRFVSSEGLAKLCYAFKVPASELFTEDHKKTKESEAKKKLNDLLRYQSDKKIALIHDISARILKDL